MTPHEDGVPRRSRALSSIYTKLSHFLSEALGIAEGAEKCSWPEISNGRQLPMKLGPFPTQRAPPRGSVAKKFRRWLFLCSR